MNKKLIGMLLFSAVFLAHKQAPSAASDAAPSRQVSVVQTPAKAINYRNLRGSVKIDFKGTVLLPAAQGEAKVWNKAGVTHIRAKFENVTAPNQFGAEYLTYVFWAISPDGRATNLGEVMIRNGRGSMRATSSLQTLSLLVTAEPYFAVSQPSDVVILDNAIKPDNKKKIELIEAKYELLPRGQYTKNISATDLPPQVLDKKTPFYVYQARNAVQIARAAGADMYEAEGLRNAERLLTLSETKDGGKKNRIKAARQSIQGAEDSRSLALKRQEEEGLTAEREQSVQDIVSANQKAAAATEGQTQAEAARAQAEEAKGQSDAERAAILALATSAAASSTEAQAQATAARASAEQSKGEADVATTQATGAEGEKAALRAQLLQQLNSVLRTQDSARGLIVNMSENLFQTGSAELEPLVREKLARIAGIIASHPGLTLDVEGHTDGVEAEADNHRLSERRAQAAKDYLVNNGVAADAISSRGFGKSNPIGSNNTPQGRAQNRRIEIIVSGDAIGKVAKAQ